MRRPDLNNEEIVKAYTSGLTISQVAEVFATSKRTIGSRLRSMGVDTSVGWKGRTDRDFGNAVCPCGAEFQKKSANSKYCDDSCEEGKNARLRSDKRARLKRMADPEKREKEREYARRSHKKNKEKNRLRRKATTHNLTEEELLSMYETQNGCCLVCGIPEDIFNLATDHDHACCPGPRSCGKCVRGLIHENHNKAIGFCHDNVDELQELIDYLRRFE